jgi:hypothetical protein
MPSGSFLAGPTLDEAARRWRRDLGWAFCLSLIHSPAPFRLEGLCRLLSGMVYAHRRGEAPVGSPLLVVSSTSGPTEYGSLVQDRCDDG